MKCNLQSLHQVLFDRNDHNFRPPRSLYPGDLSPFTRRPLFLVVDSDNSSAFASLCQNSNTSSPYGGGGGGGGSGFEQPLVVLMSPQETPTAFRGMNKFNFVGN